MTDGETLLSGALASRRNFLIGGAMLGASAVAYQRRPLPFYSRVEEKQFESWVPKAFGPWRFLTASGVVLPPPDSLSSRLYDSLFSGVYTGPDDSTVMVALAYNNVQNGVLQLHRPEICYPAGGYRLSPTKETMLRVQQRTIPANFFTATGYERTEHVLYWTRVGTEFPTDWYGQRLSVMRTNLERSIIPDGMLARFSVIDQSHDSALRTLQQFVLLFAQACPLPLSRLLIG